MKLLFQLWVKIGYTDVYILLLGFHAQFFA